MSSAVLRRRLRNRENALGGFKNYVGVMVMKENQDELPLYVLPDRTIIFESNTPKYKIVYDFIITIAEPISRPEHYQEYEITQQSLSTAFALGYNSAKIRKELDKFSKNVIPAETVKFIQEEEAANKSCRIEIDSNKHYLLPNNELYEKLLNDKEVLRLCTKEDPSVIQSNPEITKWLMENNTIKYEEQDTDAYSEIANKRMLLCVKNNEVNRLRQIIFKKYHTPIVSEYYFKRDQTIQKLTGHMKPTTVIRPYQESCLAKIFANNDNSSGEYSKCRSGFIVLPCGAGKTLVGISCALSVGRIFCVVCTSSMAVDQWYNQILLWTTIEEDEMVRITGATPLDKKKFLNDDKGRIKVLITTYQMMIRKEANEFGKETQYIDDNLLPKDTITGDGNPITNVNNNVNTINGINIPGNNTNININNNNTNLGNNSINITSTASGPATAAAVAAATTATTAAAGTGTVGTAVNNTLNRGIVMDSNALNSSGAIISQPPQGVPQLTQNVGMPPNTGLVPGYGSSIANVPGMSTMASGANTPHTTAPQNKLSIQELTNIWTSTLHSAATTNYSYGYSSRRPIYFDMKDKKVDKEENMRFWKKFNETKWGTLVLDEIHTATAKLFKNVLQFPFRFKIGLTATPIREDDEIKSLAFLLGPKLYEANWLDLKKQGFLAGVQCIEVICPMTSIFYRIYFELLTGKRFQNVIATIEQNDKKRKKDLKDLKKRKEQSGAGYGVSPTLQAGIKRQGSAKLRQPVSKKNNADGLEDLSLRGMAMTPMSGRDGMYLSAQLKSGAKVRNDLNESDDVDIVDDTDDFASSDIPSSTSDSIMNFNFDEASRRPPSAVTAGGGQTQGTGKENKNDKDYEIFEIMNPIKLCVMEYLIKWHQSKNHKILVYCDRALPIKIIAKELKIPFINKDTGDEEKRIILSEFTKPDGLCSTLIVSKIGDNSIDLPDANVLIEISVLNSSRTQEAQRLGRILRPKVAMKNRVYSFASKSSSINTPDAYFYTLLSADTKEIIFSDARRDFLLKQGYEYTNAKSLVERALTSKEFKLNFKLTKVRKRVFKKLVEKLKKVDKKPQKK